MNRRFPQEDFNDLQFAVCQEDAGKVKQLLGEYDDAEIKWTIQSKVIPRVSAVHIAAKVGNMEVLQLLAPKADINQEDQWGFTPLHYATVGKHKEAVLYLLSQGASASKESKSGTTARDIAEKLNLVDLIDALTSKINLEKDKTVPAFREWLNHLGGGEYFSKFIDGGYDLRFIKKQGLVEEDMDCVGIPKSKMGLRRKLMSLHELEKFYEDDNDDDEEEEDEDEDDEEDDDEDEEDDDEEEDE